MRERTKNKGSERREREKPLNFYVSILEVKDTEGVVWLMVRWDGVCLSVYTGDDNIDKTR